MSLEKILSPKFRPPPHEGHWIPLSDLMTGLMMMFLLVAILFMLKVEEESKKVKELMVQAQERADYVKNIAVLYNQLRNELYHDLMEEFKNDLGKWRANLDRDLTIRFEEPDVLFDTGKSALKPQFIVILDDFFPRYSRILGSQKYRDSIEEVRIEGHTSSVWAGGVTADTAYFKNMELSQSRTRSVLEHVLTLPQLIAFKAWLTSKMTANGLSSSHLRLSGLGTEDKEASQRVEFRVRTNAESRIGEILRASQQ